jgi:RNA polymerase sigma-70 factor, ECF subfamily
MSDDLAPSFAPLYQAYYPRVYRWAYRLLKHHEAAEDAAQETFLRAWRYLATFDPAQSAFSTWLYRMAVQVARNQIDYRNVRLGTLSLDSLPWEVHDREAADPQTRYEGRAEQVAVALSTMPRCECEALALYAAGYHEVEIASLVGKTPRTVRNWLARGRAQLAQRMEAEV